MEAVHEDIFDQEEAGQLQNTLRSATEATVTAIDRTTWQDHPPVPLNLATAQKAFAGTPSQVLSCLQDLYEAGHVTYPRTSNQQYAEDFDFRTKIEALRDYSPLDTPVSAPYEPTEGDVHDPAHPPITPTPNVPFFGDLSDYEEAIYRRVARHFLATLMEPAVKRKIEYTLAVDGYEFVTDTRQMKRMGYLATYGQYSTVYSDSSIDWAEGDTVDITDWSLVEKETQPPDRHSQSSVVEQMEAQGLGTSATRGGMLQKLLDRDYVIDDDGSLETTALGENLIDALEDYAPKITDPTFTEDLQKDLDTVRYGLLDADAAVMNAREWVVDVGIEIKRHEEQIGTRLTD